MSDQNENNPAPEAIDDVQIVELSEELLETVAGGDGMCSVAMCSTDEV